jgi:RNA 2',3'-cyclic 3'-phosphodiesterase
VSLPASVEGRERLRLFCALRLPDDALDVLCEWQARELRGGRVVPRSNLHVTLAFLGHRPAGELPEIAGALREAAAAARPIRLLPDRYRETRSVGMLVLKDLAGTATAVADDLFGRLERLGVYEREQRAWLPHVTVLRFRQQPRLSPSLPEPGEIVPSDAAAYLSRLGPKGAEYFVVESFVLGERVR